MLIAIGLAAYLTLQYHPDQVLDMTRRNQDSLPEIYHHRLCDQNSTETAI